jgi:hypothetical protein
MFKNDVPEATAILLRMVKKLLEVSPEKGRDGSALRTACGDLMMRGPKLLREDTIGPPLSACFELARKAGLTLKRAAYIRSTVESETPVALGAVMLKGAGIGFCLATEGRILADTAFVSRQDADDQKDRMNIAFSAAEEIAADDMDQETFAALTRLHAACSFFLIDTGRPLPRLLKYRFSLPLPSLIMAYKLYDNAGRADELRMENKVVHPAFMPKSGRALSK